MAVLNQQPTSLKSKTESNNLRICQQRSVFHIIDITVFSFPSKEKYFPSYNTVYFTIYYFIKMG